MHAAYFFEYPIFVGIKSIIDLLMTWAVFYAQSRQRVLGDQLIKSYIYQILQIILNMYYLSPDDYKK